MNMPLVSMNRRRRIGGAAPTAPSILDIIGPNSMWFDGADATTITANGSNQVTSWQSKAATNNLTQTAGSTSPLVGEVINGVAALDFRTARYMNASASLFPSTSPAEVFMAAWSDRAAFSDNTFAVYQGAGSGLLRVVRPIRAQYGTLTRLLSVVTGAKTVRSLAIHHSFVTGHTGSVTQRMSSNRRGYSEGATTINGLGTNSSIGATNTGTTAFNGLIGEIIIAHKALTDPERETIISYLENKWRPVATTTKWHIVGVAGQSNMRGNYGSINRTDDLPNTRIAQLGRTYNSTTGVTVEDTAGPIILAEHPFENRWRDTASPPPEDSVGPAMAYAKALLATLPAGENVLLVPCAQGGTFAMPQTPLSNDITWHPSPTGGRSNAPYTDFVGRMNRVISELGSAAELHSIIWHQGESDSAQAVMSQATYAANLDAILTGFRSGITGASTVPIVVGELGSFLSGTTYPNATNVNAAISDTPNRLSSVAVASSASLTDGGDSLHFSAASARTLGARMFTAFETL